MKIIICILMLVLLISCSTSMEKQESVKKRFPNGEVAFIGGDQYIVKDKDGSIWYVVLTKVFNSKITWEEKLFK